MQLTDLTPILAGLGCALLIVSVPLVVVSKKRRHQGIYGISTNMELVATLVQLLMRAKQGLSRELAQDICTEVYQQDFMLSPEQATQLYRAIEGRLNQGRAEHINLARLIGRNKFQFSEQQKQQMLALLGHVVSLAGAQTQEQASLIEQTDRFLQHQPQ